MINRDPYKPNTLDDLALDAIAPTDSNEVQLELDDIKKAVESLSPDMQKVYKFLL